MAGLARIAVHWRFSFVSSSSSRRMTLQAPGTPSAWNCRPVLTSRMLARQCLWAFSGPSQADSIQNLKTKTRSISGPCVITLHLPHSNAWQACEKDYIIQLGKTKGTLQVRPRRTKQRAFPSLAKIFTCTNVKRIRRAKLPPFCRAVIICVVVFAAALTGKGRLGEDHTLGSSPTSL